MFIIFEYVNSVTTKYMIVNFYNLSILVVIIIIYPFVYFPFFVDLIYASNYSEALKFKNQALNETGTANLTIAVSSLLNKELTIYL